MTDAYHLQLVNAFFSPLFEMFRLFGGERAASEQSDSGVVFLGHVCVCVCVFLFSFSFCFFFLPGEPRKLKKRPVVVYSAALQVAPVLS